VAAKAAWENAIRDAEMSVKGRARWFMVVSPRVGMVMVGESRFRFGVRGRFPQWVMRGRMDKWPRDRFYSLDVKEFCWRGSDS
jgi:hypothetical protein